MRTSIKVLKNGQSWHGGSHKWSLPEQDDKGNWKPGAWTANITPIWCERGWHLTDNPVAWWGDGEEVIAYLVEYEGATAGPDPDTADRARTRVAGLPSVEVVGADCHDDVVELAAQRIEFALRTKAQRHRILGHDIGDVPMFAALNCFDGRTGGAD